MKHLPIAIQTFSDMIKGNYLYIDKTKDIHKFLAEKGKYYFLSRPRRFGKSLLISTLAEIFSGNKELFKGLWIYDKIQWTKHPVITLDFTGISFDSPEVLKKSLKQFVRDCAGEHGLTLDEDRDYKEAFVKLIKDLSREGRVVVLIDEYDKPIINFVENLDMALQNRKILNNFFSALKALDRHLEFVFITGVSKFSKVSIFSDLNNLNDITLDENYATILGYTHQELLKYFDDRLESLAGKEKKEEWLEDTKTWYNGYSWDGKNFVYNPYSVLKLFHKEKFANYWFESGSPLFLVKLIEKYHMDLPRLENYEAGEEFFSSFDIERMSLAFLLFQTGYLTIKQIRPLGRRKRIYILSYPNQEVKEAFLVFLLGDLSPTFADRIVVMTEGIIKSLAADDLEKFFQTIHSLFAQIPYNIFVEDREAYYQTVIYIILMLVGINVKTEVQTNLGRIDAVIETQHDIYVMEFKLGSPQAALDQIKEKQYHRGYLSSSKKIKLIGVGFDVNRRNIGDYMIEELR